MMIRLIIHAGPLAGTEITTAAPLIRIGRDPGRNDLLIDDDQISARHVILQRSPRGTYVLEDLGSTNGTFVNGRQIVNLGRPTAVYLASGDRFRMGRTEFEVSEGVPRLMISGGPKAGREFPLDDRLITIGRAPDNLLDFEDAEVSVYHGVIRCTPLGFVLEDHNSTNGTYVNGHRVNSHVLTDGDEIKVGGNELRFLIDTIESDEPEIEVIPGQKESFANLIFVAGPHEGKKVSLGDVQAVFGRREDCTVTLEDEQVSAVHCAVTRAGNEFVVTDLRSRNGTYVNGQRITQGTSLKPGDLVAFGSSVAEMRIVGGLTTIGGGLTAMTTVMADGAYQMASQPKFVINGHVISAPRMTIGRSPACELRLDGFGVSKEHCAISWKDGFVLEDASTHGTYMNDKRVVREKLSGSHVIRIGVHMINVAVRGERCTLDAIDAATAMAAIEVAREASAHLAGAGLQMAAPAESSRFGALGSGYKTVFKLEMPDTDALVRERKQKFRQGAPAWRPSTDIKPGSLGKLAVSSAVVASLAVAAFLVFGASAAALMNHPLSEAHASHRFADQAAELGIPSNCTACHTIGSGVSDAKCGACHAGYGAGLRPEHVHPSAAVPAGHTLPGTTCQSCHREHDATPRFTAEGNPSQLGAAQNCGQASCHPNQHSSEFLRKGPPPPLVLEAGAVPSFDMPQAAFHAAHAVVHQKKSGKDVAVGCTSCHASKDGKGELVEASPGQACFRCHQGGEDHVKGQCASCHKNEHRGVTGLVRLPKGDPAAEPVSSPPALPTSLTHGGLFALAAFAPLLLFGLVSLSRRRVHAAEVVEELRSHPVEMVKRLIHSINDDKCVGCALCVQACPASVLELVDHRSRVVNFDACIQCKKCEDACAFDALRMHDADKPPPMVQMPEVDTNYQTPVEGMYLIGQASGTPQVKNASNLGRAVVQHMVQGGLRAGGGRALGAEVDVVVIGSGPAGLSAALTCSHLGLSYVLLEKQRDFSWTIRNYYHKGKPVMAEPNHVDLVGFLPHWDTTREELLAAWSKVVADQKLDIRFQANVTDVKKVGAIFNVQVSDPKGTPTQVISAARVVIAIGTMGNPRKLGCTGDELEKVKNALVDPDEWRGKNVLVVGGTDSAIEVVMALCEHNKVWLSCRGAKFDRVKPKNLKMIEGAIAAGKCIPLFATAAFEVTPTTATVEHKQDARKEQLPNDVVFAMIGGNPPIKWLQSIGVPYTDKPHSWSPPRTDELAKITAAGVFE